MNPHAQNYYRIVINITYLLLLSLVINSSLELHTACLNALNFNKSMDFYRQSLLCGSKDIPNSYKGLLIEASLIHMFVISGAHLIFVEKCLNFCLGLKQFKPVLFFLTLFASTCHFSAPATRALISFIIKKGNHRYGFFWSHSLEVGMSLIFCLVVYPKWIDSYSLILSGVASLIIGLPASQRFISLLRIYLSLIPFYFLWGFPHIMSLAISHLFLPLIGVVLIPTALLSIVPNLGTVLDQGLEFFFNSLAWMTLPKMTQGLLSSNSNPIFYWLYLILLLYGINWSSKKGRQNI